MALLRAEVGPLAAERSTANAKATRVFKACALAWGYSGDTSDSQGVLDFFLDGLVSRVIDQAKAQERDAKVKTAISEALADEPEFK